MSAAARGVSSYWIGGWWRGDPPYTSTPLMMLSDTQPVYTLNQLCFAPYQHSPTAEVSSPSAASRFL